MGHVWTAPSWQGESSRYRLGRCSHVFGLCVRFTAVTAKRIAQPLLADSAAIADITFDRAGQRFATTGLQDATVKIWFTSSLEQEGPRLAADPDATAAAAFQPGGQDLLVVDDHAGAFTWPMSLTSWSSAPAHSPVETSRGPSGRSSLRDRRTQRSAADDGTGSRLTAMVEGRVPRTWRVEQCSPASPTVRAQSTSVIRIVAPPVAKLPTSATVA